MRRATPVLSQVRPERRWLHDLVRFAEGAGALDWWPQVFGCAAIVPTEYAALTDCGALWRIIDWPDGSAE
jgi:hypothetical protein